MKAGEAKHPITGAPIRIMRTGAQLWKDEKTLYWLRASSSDTSRDKYKAVETISTSLTNTDTTFIALLESTEATFEYLATPSAAKKSVILLPKETITSEKFPKSLTNVLCLEEIHLIFPHVVAPNQGQGQGSPSSAVFLLAQVLRYSYIVGAAPSEQYPSDKITYKGSEQPTQPPQLWLITQYYESDSSKRTREIRQCLDQNIQNPLIDKIILLNESTKGARVTSSKVEQVNNKRRLHYSDVFRYIYEKVPPNTLVAFANSDIYFDETLKHLWQVNMKGRFMALLRYDGQPPQLFGPRPDSQDAWIVHSDSIKAAPPSCLPNFEFPFGKNGCDNAIAYEMLRQKFVVVNPALTIRTHHLHASGVRTYQRTDVIEKPVFLYLDPTPIQDFESISKLTPYTHKTIEHETVDTTPNFQTEKAAKIFKQMIKPTSEEPWASLPAFKEPIRKFTDSFQTSTGLVYGYNHLIIESTEESKTAWANTKLSVLQAAAAANSSIAVPLDNDVAANTHKYMLFYLSRVLSVRKHVGPGCAFYGPETDIEWLRLFNWSESQLPLMNRKTTPQVFSKEIYSVSNRATIYKEDIDTLRSYLAGTFYRVEKEKARVTIITNKYEELLMDSLEAAGYEVKIYFPETESPQSAREVLSQTDILILFDTPEIMWLIPEGAQVIEFQEDDKPSNYAAKLSAACGHEHTIIPLTKMMEDKKKQTICAAVHSVLEGNTRALAAKPVLKIPINFEGLHAHAGDSFRELARMWGAKGLVDIQEVSGACGGIGAGATGPFCSITTKADGEVVLYDRPTYKWLNATATQPTQPTQQKMLVGNPAPERPTQKAWTFWARHPRILEVAAAMPYIPYKGRTNNCVFIGNIENQVQAERRQGVWKKACDFWRLNAQPQLTQAEYFTALATSKFSLCLAGFGNKCHREIESMAMGCVLLCAPEVDTENYVNPLKEGIHFFRVASAEHALDIIGSIDETRWQQMADACRIWYNENASVEGSFKVTMAAIKQFSRKSAAVGTTAIQSQGGLKFETLFSLGKGQQPSQNDVQTVH